MKKFKNCKFKETIRKALKACSTRTFRRASKQHDKPDQIIVTEIELHCATPRPKENKPEVGNRTAREMAAHAGKSTSASLVEENASGSDDDDNDVVTMAPVSAVQMPAKCRPSRTPRTPRKTKEKTENESNLSSRATHRLRSATKKPSVAVLCPGVVDNVCECMNIVQHIGADKPLAPVDQRRWITSKRIQELRMRALEAAKKHRTFTIRGCFYSIRRGLQQRGWVERMDVHRRQSTGSPSLNQLLFTEEMPERKPGESKRSHLLNCERNIISRFLEHKPVDFLWACRKERTDWDDMSRNPGMQISRFHKKPFTSKSGMCAVLRDFHWYFEEGTAELYYPRCYNVFNAEELDEFTENFRMSACVALLRLAVESHKLSAVRFEGEPAAAELPTASVRFAIDQCRRYLRFRLHEDIDDVNAGPPAAVASVAGGGDNREELQWEQMMRHHQQLSSAEGARFQQDAEFRQLLVSARSTLDELMVLWPQFSLDGWHNIWIVKPANRCRGRGIRLMNDLRQIRELANATTNGRWVVQKYIERPLIIHNAKFDIRQWFLVTSVQPMVIWMYRESYLRFSSQEFSLVDFHESVHLTNHAVQKRYRANGKRDERLPKDNMWDSGTFQTYLRQIGSYSAWSDFIYPGMRRALIGTMLASQDLMDRRVNTFELFGADFMVTEDYQPWLLEINSSPDLAASTSVTARLCPQCLDDLVKVVVDHRANPKAPTGEFELIYKQLLPSAPAYLGLDLSLTGTKIVPKIVRNERNAGATQSFSQKTSRPTLSSINLSQRSGFMDLLDPNAKLELPEGVTMKPAPPSARAGAARNQNNRSQRETLAHQSATVDAQRRGKTNRSPIFSSRARTGRIPSIYPTRKLNNVAGEVKSKRHRSCGSNNLSTGIAKTVQLIWDELKCLEDKADAIKCVGKSYALPTIADDPLKPASIKMVPLIRKPTPYRAFKTANNTVQRPSVVLRPEDHTLRTSKSMNNLLDVADTENLEPDMFLRIWQDKKLTSAKSRLNNRRKIEEWMNSARKVADRKRNQ